MMAPSTDRTRDGRVNSKHLLFNVKNMNEAMVSRISTDCMLEGFISLLTRPGGEALCYAKKRGDQKFHFKNGCKSLAKKLGCDYDNILALVPTKLNNSLPEDFLKSHLDPSTVDEQVQFAVGCYTKEIIKAAVTQNMKLAKNKRTVEAVVSGGTSNCVKEGILSMGEAAAADRFLAKEKEEEEKIARLKRDVPRGVPIEFTCHKTQKKYQIVSCKDCDSHSAAGPTLSSEDMITVGDVISLDDVLRQEASTHRKKKHYFFYSKKGGYGKSCLLNVICKKLNACMLRDLNNIMNVSEYAQFLCIDEYGPTKRRRFDMEDLKGLTSGSAEGFTGNRKSFGASFTPRSDVQLIITSNKHLFDCMGTYDPKTKKRFMSKEDAALLRQRFFIHKLDEDKTGPERADAEGHIEGFSHFGGMHIPGEDSEEEEEYEGSAETAEEMGEPLIFPSARDLLTEFHD